MDNPYQAPVENANVADDSAEARLASRWMRLVAAVFDGVLQSILVWTILYALFGITFEKAKAGLSVQDTVIAAICGYAIFFALNSYLLAKNSQTIGKYLTKIKVVLIDDSRIPFKDLILKRYVPVWVVSQIPYIRYLTLVDLLFIFRKDKRCVHDLIAGTKVVKVIPAEPDASPRLPHSAR